MANLYLTLDLKKKKLYDEDGNFEYSFGNWSYGVKSKEFELGDLTISYDVISEFIFDKEITSDKADAKIEDDTVTRLDVYNYYEKFIEPELNDKIETFIADKDLADGDYEVKYTYWFDFSENEFVVEVQEVIAND